MIAAGLDWADDPRFDLSRIASSLGLLSQSGANSETIDGDFGSLSVLAQTTLGRSPSPSFPARLGSSRRTGWRAARSPSGRATLLAGWIDNADEIARELGLPASSDPAAVYGAAVEAFGIAAERRFVGDYVSIMVMGSGVLRLSRSPWARHPLFWASEGSVALAASIPRPIFAAGFPKKGNLDHYAAAIYKVASSEGESHFFEGVYRVPMGSVVTLDHGKPERVDWYDRHALGETRLKRDEDYVEAANALLSDAVAAALKPARNPAIMLSGGLDSPLVAAEMLRQMPQDQKLKSFTFEPMAGDHGPEDPGLFHSDRPAVEAFAAMHPRIEPTFVDNQGAEFQQRLQDYFFAADAAYPSLALVDMEGVRHAAAQAGCDWLLSADFGNQTFSNDGRWAYLEFLTSGKWLELWRMLRDHPGDNRPMLRRLAARSFMPLLPQFARSAIRNLIHGEPSRSLLRDEVVERLGLEARNTQIYGDREWSPTRRHLIDLEWHHLSGGTEMSHAVEQLTGLRVRAVPQYRPLIEFCMSIPTDQYVRGGEMRWLARRMAVGKMPEPQRTNTRYGRHNVDWLRRNTPHVAAMREELERIADDPVMSRIIDVDRAIDRLDEWPDTPSIKGLTDVYIPIASAIIGSRFARYVDGRN